MSEEQVREVIERIGYQEFYRYYQDKDTLIELQKQEIERLKEEYMILQNASDEVEEEKDKEIERLSNIINKAIEYIEEEEYVDYNPTLDGSENDSYMKLPRSLSLYNEELDILLDILKGSDKE